MDPTAMARALAALLVAAALGTPARAYDPMDPSVAAACQPLACSSTWTAWGGNLTLPCSTASGHLPLGLPPVQLPLIFNGNYDLCRTFEDAHFCTVRTKTPVILPILDKHFKPVSGVPLGSFILDQCVSKSCDLAALKRSFLAQAERIAEKIRRDVSPAAGDVVEDVLAALKTVSVSCGRAKRDVDAGFVIVVGVLVVFAMAVTACSLVAVYGSGPILDARMVRWFSMPNNGARLVAAIPGDFNVLNGMRFLSMVWVILGHSVLMYSQDLINPNAQARVLRSFEFIFIRGAEYAVDTFFFMSGFLAAWGMVQQFSKRALTAKTYGLLVLGRFLRLTPTYMIVVFFTWKVLPFLGEGPNWDAIGLSTDRACEGNWVYNLLYVNNLFPWHQAGAMDICCGWTWYLANDFQFFLLAPLLVQAHQTGLSASSGARSLALRYGPCVALVVMQIVVTSVLLAGYNDNPATDPHFQDGIYTKPWCRVTPYAIGVLLALVHFERTEKAAAHEGLGHEEVREPGKPWKRLAMPVVQAQSIMVASIVGMFALCAALYWQWRCDETEHECDVFYSQYKFGFFLSPNWSKAGSVFYFAWCYLFWSVPLAAFSYLLICDSRYDVLRLKWFLSHPVFTPLARLTYNAYLVHIPIQTFVIGSSQYALNWLAPRITLEIVGYVFFAYFLSFCLYMVVEKPIMNMTASLFHGMRSPPSTEPPRPDARFGSEPLPLDRQFSTISDVDSEAVHLASSPVVAPAAVGADDEPEYARLDNS